MKDINVPIINKGILALLILGATTALGVGAFKYGARRAAAVLPEGKPKEILKEVIE